MGCRRAIGEEGGDRSGRPAKGEHEDINVEGRSLFLLRAVFLGCGGVNAPSSMALWSGHAAMEEIGEVGGSHAISALSMTQCHRSLLIYLKCFDFECGSLREAWVM